METQLTQSMANSVLAQFTESIARPPLSAETCKAILAQVRENEVARGSESIAIVKQLWGDS